MGSGIQFAGIQDVVVLAVIDMVAFEAIMSAHMHAMGKGYWLAPVFAILLFYRTCIQHGKGENAGEYKQNKYGTENGFFW